MLQLARQWLPIFVYRYHTASSELAPSLLLPFIVSLETKSCVNQYLSCYDVTNAALDAIEAANLANRKKLKSLQFDFTG